jgi:hypothetical protein
MDQTTDGSESKTMKLIHLEIFSSAGTIPGDRGIDWAIVARTSNSQKLLFWRLGHMCWNAVGRQRSAVRRPPSRRER